MQFLEKLAHIRDLIAQRDAIDDQLRELIGEVSEATTDKPKRGRPRKEKSEPVSDSQLSLGEGQQ